MKYSVCLAFTNKLEIKIFVLILIHDVIEFTRTFDKINFKIQKNYFLGLFHEFQEFYFYVKMNKEIILHNWRNLKIVIKDTIEN